MASVVNPPQVGVPPVTSHLSDASSLPSTDSEPSETSDDSTERDENTPPTSEGSASAPVSQILVNGRPVDRDSVISVDEFLPDGMGVREALARCEDPTLGWSLQFWITIADPLDQHVFFACPATGQTSWFPPQGVFIVPRQPDGEWWELADKSRNNRSYFYNTLTRETQWTRPGQNQFVIPLGLIQGSSQKDDPRTRTHSVTSASHLRPNDSTSPLARGRHQSDPPSSTAAYSGPRPPPSPMRDTFGPVESVATPLKREAQNLAVPRSQPSPSTPTFVTPHAGSEQISPASPTPRTPTSPLAHRRHPRTLSVVGESEEITDHESGYGDEADESGNEADQSVVSGRTGLSAYSDRTVRKAREGETRFEEKRETGRGFLGMLGKQGRSKTSPADNLSSTSNDLPPMLSAPWMKRNGSSLSVSISSPIGWSTHHHNNSSVPILPLGKPHAPIPIKSSVRSKRLSTGNHPILPSTLSAEIQNLSGPEFASVYFATRRSGLLWQKQPFGKVLEWQKHPITAPLLTTSKGQAGKDAVTCFKVVQRTMSQRARPVEGARSMPRSASSLPDMAGLLSGSGSAGGIKWLGRKDVAGGQSEKMVVLEEIRWMIQVCVTRPELKDEVYCQVVKQVNKNPNHESIVLGFQLFSVLSNAFSPGPAFQSFVRQFLGTHLDSPHNNIAKMARYALAKMSTAAARSGRGRALTTGEIEHASDAAFYPSVYGESLFKIMRDQSNSHDQAKVPVILPFLARAILRSGGLKAEGIFRIPGDGDVVSEIKSRIDRGHYLSAGIVDPHIAASLFKLWLRELEEPLIPSELYNGALASASFAEPDKAIKFVDRLPVYNRRVLLYVIGFLQMFCKDEVVAVTKMTSHNLALILAPNILRTTSDSLEVVFNNSGFESRFVLHLLQHLKVDDVDKDYSPSAAGAFDV